MATRRAFLAAIGGGIPAASAGCLAETGLLADPPDLCAAETTDLIDRFDDTELRPIGDVATHPIFWGNDGSIRLESVEIGQLPPTDLPEHESVDAPTAVDSVLLADPPGIDPREWAQLFAARESRGEIGSILERELEILHALDVHIATDLVGDGWPSAHPDAVVSALDPAAVTVSFTVVCHEIDGLEDRPAANLDEVVAVVPERIEVPLTVGEEPFEPTIPVAVEYVRTVEDG